MIELYGSPTPSAYTIAIMLEEIGFNYSVFPINKNNSEQLELEFLKTTPNNIFPVILDRQGPANKPLVIFEPGAILMYLAEKSGQLMPGKNAERIDVLQWLLFESSKIGPILGNTKHFMYHAPEEIPYAVKRFNNEAKRVFSIIENQLSENEFLAGDYSIADIATFPWLREYERYGVTEIISIIRKAHPNHGILGEEGGELTGKEDIIWIIDPLDGTRNFIHGFPHFAVSIAISIKGKIEHGVIYDPIRQELFTATRGAGAKLNDRRMRVSKHKSLEECLLGTGFPFRHSADLVTAYTQSLAAVLPFAGDVRRAGAATLDLAYVAAGRLDGFWEMGLKIWDIAAGSLMIKEAGGLVCDFLGGENFLESGNIVAANPKILKPLMQKIRPHLVSNSVD